MNQVFWIRSKILKNNKCSWQWVDKRFRSLDKYPLIKIYIKDQISIIEDKEEKV